MITDRTFMVFDVESMGLHGDGFAVGWVVQRGDERLEEGIAVSRTHDPLDPWVAEHVLPALPRATHETERGIRETFWTAWKLWRCKDALLAADVAWPVEANFLTICIAEGLRDRDWDGPYPLIDIASVRLAVGLDPLAGAERLADELPAHNPLNDARQSARLLIEALELVRG